MVTHTKQIATLVTLVVPLTSITSANTMLILGPGPGYSNVTYERALIRELSPTYISSE